VGVIQQSAMGSSRGWLEDAALGDEDDENKKTTKIDPALAEWIDGRLRFGGDVPRVSDILEHARLEGISVKQKDVVAHLQLHPVYLFNLEQHRQPKRSRKYRPIVATSLGQLHADIGFFSKSKHYATPPTFQAGFLVAKDVLSRFVYLVPLRKNRKAESMIAAFRTLLAMHAAAGHAHPVQSISFDRETSVMSRKVQDFLADSHIKFTAFKMSSSKAKHAESAIKQVRTAVARLERLRGPETRWWQLLPEVQALLNRREIVVDGRRLGFAAADVSVDNLDKFLAALYKAAPAYFAAQFNLDTRHARFRYSVGQDVRAKLVVVSSAVLGVKHSETNLTDDVFRITALVPFVTRRMSVGSGYRCVNLRTGVEEIFEEQDVVPTDATVESGDRHVGGSVGGLDERQQPDDGPPPLGKRARRQRAL